jgi:hypothetical protein
VAGTACPGPAAVPERLRSGKTISAAKHGILSKGIALTGCGLYFKINVCL